MNLAIALAATFAWAAGVEAAAPALPTAEQHQTEKTGMSGNATGRLTAETLWEMGRVGSFALSPDGRQAVYAVSYYSVEQNKGHHVLYQMDLDTKKPVLLTQTEDNESAPAFIAEGGKVAFLSNAGGTSQVWEMNPDGTGRRQLTHEPDGVSGFLFSPDGKKVILIKDVPTTSSIQAKEPDLPLAQGMVIDDLMYKHWDHYVTTVPHPFVADVTAEGVKNAADILAGEPYECPMLPFGGTEQLAWSPDSRTIAYTCRKKTGVAYAISTDSDIYLYDCTTRKTRNLCKPAGYVQPQVDPTFSLEKQAVNAETQDCNVGYDQNPQFSPDGRYVAWSSMARDGYESDRTRLCVYELRTGKKTYVTESFESGVNEFLWANDSKTLYFTGVWHGVTPVYRTNLEGRVQKLAEDTCDYSLVALSGDGDELYVGRQSMSTATEIYCFDLSRKKMGIEQITFENQKYYDTLAFGDVRERWVKTTDGKLEQCWVIYPPHFDPAKKYPALLFCQGGPQSPVSQSWSVRWNFQLMAANDYIIIAPNRRGLPGYGMEWLEQISGDYPGQCMRDYLSAIDDLSREPYVDKERLGCVGASFGGYSVYWLAGHHDGRFKCFIAHDGIYNTQQQYVETEEMWFPNWDMGRAPWIKDAEGRMVSVFENSPHLFVNKWDTPILCIHGQKDFRIEYTQAESAFAAARLHGIPAQLLLLPDENHWVLKPQNGILWQRTFFRWLDRWLKK